MTNKTQPLPPEPGPPEPGPCETSPCETSPRESMTFDVVIVGGGPAGLACAIRIRQQAQDTGRDISVCVLEKGGDIGAHVLSGAVIDPKGLAELFPDWQHMDTPLKTRVIKDSFVFLTKTKAFRLWTPPALKNTGNFIGSLGALTRWLGEQAENLGVDVFTGFAACDVLYTKSGQVKGVLTGDQGRTKDGTPGENFQPGMELLASYTIFAEGCRGSLSEDIKRKFNLCENAQPQTYALGIKEIWEIDAKKSTPGHVVHTVGWPLSRANSGGSFIYHMENNKLAVGLITGLDYENPYLSPFEDMQRFKTHPKISPLFKGARRISFGARALNEGGFQSIPKQIFPGGALIGAAAGFLNVAKLKGSHTAIKSAIACADAICEALQDKVPCKMLEAYPKALKSSWLWRELFTARNIRPAFRKGLFWGLVYGFFDTCILRGRAPWTFKHAVDHAQLKRATRHQHISYPKPDGVLTFDRESSLHLANIGHSADQPCHLKIIDPSLPVATNLVLFDGPETRYCPANVFEFIADANESPHLVIHSENCLHCKTCDIKDPSQNIKWTPPEGSNGPNYSNM